MRKIICFLGARPSKCTYLWNNIEQVEGEQFAEVLIRKEQFDQMWVFSTEEARKSTYPLLEKYGDPRINPVDIPDGNQAGDYWVIFEKVIEKIDENDEVIFDITHGFRSLPFLTFLFAAYLKTARNAVIVAVYYGALEMARSHPDGLAPVLELSEFVKMLDWIIAADLFLQTSDARKLATLLERRSGTSKKAAKNLEAVSLAAFLCQPFSLGAQSGNISPNLEAAATEFSITSIPFTVLANRIADHFSALSLTSGASDEDKIILEYRLIRRYYSDKQWVQFVTLSREWLIDVVTVHLGEPLDFSRKSRSRFEDSINILSLQGSPLPNEKRNYDQSDLNKWGVIIQTWDEKEIILKAWRDIRTIRNQIDHAEHQAPSLLIALDNMEKKMAKIYTSIQKLAETWHYDHFEK